MFKVAFVGSKEKEWRGLGVLYIARELGLDRTVED